VLDLSSPGDMSIVMAHVVHRTHPDIVKRLKRAEGHLRNVIGMMESGRPCLDVAQQLHAVERAVTAAKRTMVHDHIEHCLTHAVEDEPRDVPRTIEEFKEITKYL
jgi:DNA-binding FrmR family transcriptional regulator